MSYDDIKTHHYAEEPHVEDLEKNVFDGPALRVSYRIVQGLVPEWKDTYKICFKSKCPNLVIPVEGDGTEVEDGGRAAEDIKGEPGLADEAAEHPP